MGPTRRLARRFAGVTLIELLLVIAILGIVTAFAARVGRECLRVWDEQSRLMVANRALADAARVVTRDLLGAMRVEGVAFEGEPQETNLEDIVPIAVTLEKGQPKTRVAIDRLAFATGHTRDPLGHPAGEAVEYTVARDEAGKLRGLVRRAAALDAAAQKESPPVSEHIAEFRVEYLRKVGGRETWEKNWRAADGLPAAVRVTLGAWVGDASGVSLQRLTTMVTIRATEEARVPR